MGKLHGVVFAAKHRKTYRFSTKCHHFVLLMKVRKLYCVGILTVAKHPSSEGGGFLKRYLVISIMIYLKLYYCFSVFLFVYVIIFVYINYLSSVVSLYVV